MKNQDPYQQLELLAQQKALYLPHPPKNYQRVTIPTRLKYYYQSVDLSLMAEGIPSWKRPTRIFIILIRCY